MNQKAEAEIELEYKALLSQAKYKEMEIYLTKISQFQEEYKQDNYYFDNSTMSLKERKITLRLRKKKGTWELTIKTPMETTFERCTTKKEYNYSITNEQAEWYLKEGIKANDVYVQSILKEYQIGDSLDYNCLGVLETIRMEFCFYTDIICLDKNTYLSVVDYELEWETSNPSFVEDQFDLLKLIDLPSKGKRSRFLKKLKTNKILLP